MLINSYFSSIGGRGFYDYLNINFSFNSENNIPYYLNNSIENNINVFHKTLVWLAEENYKLNCEQTILLVKQGDFIGKDFEITPDCFSKTSGLISIIQKNNIVQRLTIKEGCVYQGTEFSDEATKVYYPGEQIFENITVTSPSICERFLNKNIDQLLVRPIEIYEFPYSNKTSISSFLNPTSQSIFNLTTKASYFYKSNQSIKGSKQLIC